MLSILKILTQHIIGSDGRTINNPHTSAGIAEMEMQRWEKGIGAL